MTIFAIICYVCFGSVSAKCSDSIPEYSDKYGENAILINGDENIVVTGNDVNITIQKRVSNADLSVICGVFDQEPPVVISEGYAYNCVTTFSEALRTGLSINATNTNDVALKIENISLKVRNYSKLKNPKYYHQSFGSEGEVEAQIFVGVVNSRSKIERLSYIGSYDPYDILCNDVVPERLGTYVRLNPGESEDLVLAIDYEPGLYVITICVDYILAGKNKSFESDAFTLYFVEDSYNYVDFSGDATGVFTLIDKCIAEGKPVPGYVVAGLDYCADNPIEVDQSQWKHLLH